MPRDTPYLEPHIDTPNFFYCLPSAMVCLQQSTHLHHHAVIGQCLVPARDVIERAREVGALSEYEGCDVYCKPTGVKAWYYRVGIFADDFRSIINKMALTEQELRNHLRF